MCWSKLATDNSPQNPIQLTHLTLFLGSVLEKGSWYQHNTKHPNIYSLGTLPYSFSTSIVFLTIMALKDFKTMVKASIVNTKATRSLSTLEDAASQPSKTPRKSFPRTQWTGMPRLESLSKSNYVLVRIEERRIYFFQIGSFGWRWCCSGGEAQEQISQST